MKRIVLFVALVMLATSAYAEKVVGTYTCAETQKNIEAYIDDKGVLKVFVEVLGEYQRDKVMIKIDGENDINKFIAQLKYCKEKFIEWEKVAKTNNIKDFKKNFDVTFPNVEIWWRGSEWFSSYKRNFIKPLFIVNDGKASFGAGGEATDWNNEYIDQDFYLILISTAEFDSLIKALNPQTIKNVLNQDTQADALFQ